MRTVILSDCHIGSPEAHVGRVNRFLFSLECDKLILAGDFWDLWDMSTDDLKRTNDSTIRQLKKLMQHGTKIEYILGNHDENYLKSPVMPLDEIVVVKNWNITTPNGKKIAIIHGHDFDKIYTNWYWVQRSLAWLNGVFKKTIGVGFHDLQKKTCTGLKGKDYWQTVHDIHKQARKHYQKLGFDALIMGHTHAPMHIKKNELPEFINAGDWKVHDSYVVIEDDNISLRFMGTGTDDHKDYRWFRLDDGAGSGVTQS
jgi:UDP-2,3-diacylglucosamine pyrophosphatase LpxH